MSLPPKPGVFRVREATPADASILTALRGALFEEIGSTVSPEQRDRFEVESVEAIGACFATDTCVAWIAEDPQGRPIGSVVMLIHPRLPSLEILARREGYLLSVYTSPDWRNHGVATALLDSAIGRARQLGLARIRLHATEPGRPVYQALGFRLRDNEMELPLVK